MKKLLRRLPITVCLALAALVSSTAAVAQQSTPVPDLRWRMVGPFRGGRTRAIAGVPGQPIYYIAQVNGGIWKSDDAGRTWDPIFDAQPTQSIGSIALAPSNPNIIYAGSGEGLHRPDLSVGNGVYKSTDAGRTWSYLGLPDAQQIPSIAVDPRDPNHLFVAVLGHPYGPNEQRGVFRSSDGGASWQKVLYKDVNTGASEVEIDPQNPDTVYAALWESRLGPGEDRNDFSGTGGGLFKSTDGGQTWHQLKKGLPDNLVQIDVAIAPSRPSRLYATIGTTEPNAYMTSKGAGFFRSDDGGESWTRITEDARPAMFIGGGDLPVPRVDPANPDIVYTASIVTSRSTDGGKTWTSLRGAPGGDDYQNVWVDPKDPNTILLGSDQGAVLSRNGGRTWTSWYNQPTAQLYHIGVTPTFPYRICSGQQESGSVCIASRGDYGEITFRDWKPVGVIEYGYVTPDPLNPDLVYGAGRTQVTRYHWSTGQVENVTPIPIQGKHRAERTEPMIFSPVDPHIVYYCSNTLFESSDGGEHWSEISPDLARENPGIPPSIDTLASKNPKAATARGAIYSLAPARHDVNVLWAGTDDGALWTTRDGGKNWSNITPPAITAWSKVTQIDASAYDDQSAYVSVSRFRVDDLHAYIYRTHDGGRTWQLINNGLPESPVNTVREDPVRKGLLFAGTETAVWMSFDDGDHWQPLQLNLPHTSVRDLLIHGDDLIAATHGRGFWILDDISALRQLRRESLEAPSFVFAPATAIRVRRSLNTDTPIPPDEPMAENPPDGAIIDYSLGQAGPARLEIVDADGNVVRRYSSSDSSSITAEQLAKQTIPPYWVRVSQPLAESAGLHRFVWDLRYAPPSFGDPQYPISAVPHDTPTEPLGPLALPGTYTVRLIANGRTSTAPLTVVMDPRITAAPSAIRQMFDAETHLSSMLTETSKALGVAKSITEQLDRHRSDKAKNSAEIERYRAEVDAVVNGPAKPAAPQATVQPTKKDEVTQQRPGAPAPPTPEPPTLSGVNETLGGLYGMVDQADAAPTAAQMEAVERATRDTEDVMKRWQAVEKRLPTVNEQLRREHLEEVHPAEGAVGGTGAHEE